MQPRLSIANRIALGLAGAVFVAAAVIAACATIGAQATGARAVLVAGVAIAAAFTVFVTGARMLRQQLRTLQQLAAAIDSVELDGSPLYRNLPERGPAEVERIVAAWNGFALRFDILMHNLRSATTRLNERTQQLSNVGPHAARRAELQAEALRQFVDQLEDADRAPAAHAADGHDGDLAAAVTRIGADATLLGINAAIAAAQAGESGRDFAAVAAELRALAQRIDELVRSPADGGATAHAGAPPDAAMPPRPHPGVDRSGDDGAATLLCVAERLLAEATTVARRTGELATAATAAATAAAEVEAQLWPPPEVDDRDIVAIDEGTRTHAAPA